VTDRATDMAGTPPLGAQGPLAPMPVRVLSAPDPALTLTGRFRRALGLSIPAPPDPARRAPLYRRVLRALDPTNFPGPIFQKEVWISGRKAGTYWARALYTAGMLGFVTLIFTTVNFERFVSSPAQRLQVSQEIAPAIFTTVIGFQFLALALAGCILGAPTICEEKRAGTLGTLLTTPLRPWQIVVGKTAAFFVQILILTLIATPLMLAIRVFGGLTSEVVVACTCLSLSTALLAGLLGLLASIGAKRTPGAILSAIIFLVFSQGAVPLLYMIRDWCGQTVSWWNLIYACAPAAALMQLIGQYGAPVPHHILHDAWISSTAYNLGLCAMALVLASLRLRRTMIKEAAGGSPIPAGKKSRRSRRTAEPTDDVPEPQVQHATPVPAALLRPDGAPSLPESAPGAPPLRKKKRRVYDHASRDVADQPVLWRELRQSSFRSRLQLIGTSSVFLALLGLLYWKVGLSEDGLHGTLTIIAIIASLCIAAVSTTSGISGERESRTWEALLTTPLSARQIVAGKFLGAIRRQWFVPALLAAHFAASVLYFKYKHDGFHAVGVPYVFAVLTAPIIAMSGTGVLFSLLCRKSTLAAVCNFGLAVILWAAAPFVALLITEVLNFRGTERQDLLNVIFLFNPVGMAAESLEVGFRNRYELFHWGEVGPETFTLVIAGYCTFYVLTGVICVRIAAGVLAARSNRRA
jgi:ABC-type transport system involved in multi-copper enzyme maturation permease subunit